MCTLSNEIVKIPNHTLFSEKIYNLKENDGGGGVTFEILLTINSKFSPELGTQVAIDDLFGKIKRFCDDRPDKWQNIYWAAVNFSMGSSDGKITDYKIWATHTTTLQDFKVPFLSRSELLEFIKLQTSSNAECRSPKVGGGS